LNVTSTNYSYNPLLKGLEEGVETVVEASLRDSNKLNLNNNTSNDQWETWGHTVQGTYILPDKYSTYTLSPYRCIHPLTCDKDTTYMYIKVPYMLLPN